MTLLTSNVSKLQLSCFTAAYCSMTVAVLSVLRPSLLSGFMEQYFSEKNGRIFSKLTKNIFNFWEESSRQISILFYTRVHI